MRALVFDSGNLSFSTSASEPTLRPGEALVRPTKVAIASSDLAVARGRIEFSGILGHEFVGIVESLHEDEPVETKQKLVGTRVVGSINAVCGKCDLCRAGLSNHCPNRSVLGIHERDGCFAERFTLPVRNLVTLSDDIDDDAAVFCEPLAAALHTAQLIRVEGKPYVTILGDGPMGLLAAQVMAKLNASVRLLGRHPNKFGLCEKWGIKHRHVDEVGRRQDQDIVVDCTGGPTGLALAMQLVRPRGKIVLKTTPGPVPIGDGSSSLLDAKESLATIDLAPIVLNEIELIGARCGSINDAVAMMARGQVDTHSLITKRARLDDGVNAMQAAAQPDQIKVIMDV